MLRIFLLLAPTLAQALTGSTGSAAGGLALTDGPFSEPHDLVVSTELVDLGEAAGYGLSGEHASELLGQFGTTAEQALATLAPHLESCRLELTAADTGGSGRAVHERYRLRCGAYLAHDALLTLHHLDNKLIMVRARLPSYRLPAEALRDDDFLSLASLGALDLATLDSSSAVRVIADLGGLAAPAWSVVGHDADSGLSHRWLVDAQTGVILAHEAGSFDLTAARVYERGPQDGKLIDVELEGLPPSGLLDGANFRVYAPDAASPRAAPPFAFSPEDPGQALSFDQVQVYYGAMRALRWLEARFGYDGGKVKDLVVRVNEVIGGSVDNAQYLPPPKGPAILVGKGGGTLANLARDSDVVTHELMHHVIFEFLQSHRGESGIFHEGTADYFSYALNGDPNLAESTVRAGGPLRTALLDTSARFDSFALGRNAHTRGQVWSALLWELRGLLGEDFDRVVFESLRYLGPSSGFRDAFIGMLNADLALTGARDRCRILQVAARRGFGMALEELDGTACGLDLRELARESRALYDRNKPASGETKATWEDGVTQKLCGTVASASKRATSQTLSLFVLLVTSLLPWALRWTSKKS
jgi:hypothetical protein